VAIALVQGTHNANNTGGFVASVSYTWPASTTLHNYLAACFVIDEAGGTITAPTGMTLRLNASNGSVCQLYVYEEVDCAVRSGTQTFSWTAAAVDCAVIAVAEYSGVATASPNDGTNQTATGATTTPKGGALTTTNASDLILTGIGQCAVTSTNAIALSGGAPAGTVVRQTANTVNATATTTMAVGLLEQIVSSIQTAQQWSCTSNRNFAWVGATWAVKAAAASRGLFRDANLATGAGGSFFVNPLEKWGGRPDFERERLARLRRRAYSLAG
jgi:hypothetical protein